MGVGGGEGGEAEGEGEGVRSQGVGSRSVCGSCRVCGSTSGKPVFFP